MDESFRRFVDVQEDPEYPGKVRMSFSHRSPAVSVLLPAGQVDAFLLAALELKQAGGGRVSLDALMDRALELATPDDASGLV